MTVPFLGPEPAWKVSTSDPASRPAVHVNHARNGFPRRHLEVARSRLFPRRRHANPRCPLPNAGACPFTGSGLCSRAGKDNITIRFHGLSEKALVFGGPHLEPPLVLCGARLFKALVHGSKAGLCRSTKVHMPSRYRAIASVPDSELKAGMLDLLLRSPCPNIPPKRLVLSR